MFFGLVIQTFIITIYLFIFERSEFKKFYDSNFIKCAGEKYLATLVPFGLKGNREFSKMKKMFSNNHCIPSKNAFIFVQVLYLHLQKYKISI